MAACILRDLNAGLEASIPIVGSSLPLALEVPFQLNIPEKN